MQQQQVAAASTTRPRKRTRCTEAPRCTEVRMVHQLLPQHKAFDMIFNTPSAAGPYGLPTISAVVGAESTTAFYGMTELNNIVQGNDSFNRIGNLIRMTSIDYQVEYAIYGAAPVNVAFRDMLLIDFQSNGAFPAVGDIFALQGTANGYANNYFCGFSLPNIERFKLLYQKYDVIENQQYRTILHTGTAEINAIASFKSNLGTIADITSGALLFIAMQDNTGSANEYCTCQNRMNMFRVHYYDVL